jgi:hypothetical protein
MPKVPRSLGALLSLLMAASSVSASTCDLTCWLRQAHVDCHSFGPATTDQQTPKSMPEHMDMGPGHRIVVGPDPSVNPGHSMSSDPGLGPGCQAKMMGLGARMITSARLLSMSLPMGVAARQFRHETKPETAMADRPPRGSPCTHELCRQISAPMSPSSGDNSQDGSLPWTAIGILSSVHLGTGVHWTRAGIPPPRLLAVGRLTAILRI